MNMQKIRMMLALAVLSVALFVGSATPAAARGPIVELTPLMRGCEWNGQIYPVGKVLTFPMPDGIPDVKLKCTLSFRFVDGRAQAVYDWKIMS